MPKFKQGDKLRCIKVDPVPKREYQRGSRGAGWKDQLVFKVDQIRTEANGTPIYFGGVNGHGVYEDQVELAELKNQLTKLKEW